ncbi:hypothetical protein, partial [Streptococcus pneumoniae]|uniref:hypothetical protein n=1 Tax=Streptococcus pneumoniae TaxID=1313 RepID=UPI0018B05F32
IKRYRGANDNGYFAKIAKEAEKMGITPEELFNQLKGMKLSDVDTVNAGKAPSVQWNSQAGAVVPKDRMFPAAGSGMSFN